MPRSSHRDDTASTIAARGADTLPRLSALASVSHPARRTPVGARAWALRFALWLSLWLSLGAGDAWAAPTQPSIPYRERVLDNGLRVILHHDERVPIIAINLRYGVGSMDDPADVRGLAHTVEHLMFRGSAHVDDGEHFLRLQRVGGVGANASTEPGGMSFVQTVPRAALATALWLESDRMGFFRPTAEAVRSEIETVANEWSTRVDSEPRAILLEQVWNAMFPPTHPLHQESAGSVRAVTLPRVETFARAHLGPGNAILVLAGDLPPNVDAIVDRWFGDLRGGRPPARATKAAATGKGARLAPRATLARSPMVYVGWPTPGLYDTGDAEADVLATALNAERFQTIARALGRDPDRIVLFEAQQISMPGQSGFFMAASGRPGVPPSELLETIDAVLAEVARTGLPDGDVRRARKRLSMGLLPALETLEGRAQLLAVYASAGRDPDFIAEDLARYDAVGSKGVAAFVRTHLAEDRRVVLLNEGRR
jgi:zinc protease